MKIVGINKKIAINPDKSKIINFLESHLSNQDILFEELRNQLQIKISDKALHRIVIDAGYGVIK